jgi:hypothetical protein
VCQPILFFEGHQWGCWPGSCRGFVARVAVNIGICRGYFLLCRWLWGIESIFYFWIYIVSYILQHIWHNMYPIIQNALSTFVTETWFFFRLITMLPFLTNFGTYHQSLLDERTLSFLGNILNMISKWVTKVFTQHLHNTFVSHKGALNFYSPFGIQLPECDDPEKLPNHVCKDIHWPVLR